nr:DUF2637 domain-containing protein [Kibdelosporangium sp. MJ126-NF4]CEL19689.1 hypothetical protein [Kibdelosporangium sp. MJ126-NF4]CTQ96914.1 hypothetical protein [Kibdelosporangium sp. MJ126-NF4]
MTTTNELSFGSPTGTQMDDQAEQFVDQHEVEVDQLYVVERPDDEVPPAPSPDVTDADTASLAAIEDDAALAEPEQHARSAWLLSVDGGTPWTGAALAERFGKPAGWGWARIAEVYEARGPREFARIVWQASVAAGTPLTGRELAEVFRRSERWGRDRIAEARQASGDGTTETATARRSRTGKPTNGKPRPAANGNAHRHTTEQPTEDSGTPDTVAVEQVPHDAPTRRDEPTTDTAATTAKDVPLPGGARLVAWAGFLFGTAISVAANVLYAWLPTLSGRAGPPGLAPQIGAAVWPIALVISVEVLSRVAWRPGWAWQLARYGGAGVVALGAAVISYGHLSGVLTHWGYGTTGAAVGPLVVDGLMTISGFALLAMSHSGTTSGKEAGR